MQWMDALRDQGQDVVPVFASHTGWYAQVKNIFLAAHISDAVPMPCLVCVNDTFKDGRFQELLDLLADARQPHHFLIVDECHHFNGPDHIRSLPEHFTFRLGLSATPYDQYAQRYLDAYFGGIVYEFSLGRAIKEGFLTSYRYHVIPVYLDVEETQVYEEITQKIVQIAGSEDGFTPETLAKAQPLLLRRARLVGATRDKLVQLEQHLRSTGRTPYTLFYCGDGSLEDDGARQRQIELVSQLLHKLGWRTSRITAEESLKEREALLDSLRRQSIDAVVSIKVLDEGIDIPTCRSAYLLASQSSDRQGIQRRGRVLRRSEGKDVADLYDFVVLGGATTSKSMRSLATKELRRAWQFASDAGNCATLLPSLTQTAMDIGVNVGDSIDKR
jgi:superfamily II DNA or RNA helicase